MDLLVAIFIVVAAAVLLLVAVFLALIVQIFTGKSIRNPDYPPVIGTFLHMLFYFNSLYDYLTLAAKKHRTFRLLFPDHSEVYTTDVRNIEYILKTNFDNYATGKLDQDVLADLLGQGIFAVDGEKWKQQRKLASFEFSTRVLRDFSCKVFRKNAVRLVETVSGFSKTGRGFDVHALLMGYTLDSIFRVSFGMDLNCLQGSNKEGREFIRAFDSSNALVFWRFVDPLWKLKKWLNIGSEASLKRNIKFIQDFADKIISNKNKQRESDEREDIVSRFLIESKKDPEQMNAQYLRDIILNFIIAGKDTTANTLSWFLYLLCKNPIIQEKIAQEVREVINGQLGHESDISNFVASITDEVLEQMHYLHAALTETLRLYPPVPLDGMSAKTDDTLPDGFKLKSGDAVYYMSYTMGRMTYIWGDDAEDFRPERWLENGIFQPESPFKFIAFHAGPRACLGKAFAYRQMKIASMALIRFFKFRLASEKANVTYKTMFTLHINGGLHLLAFPRTGVC